MAEILRPRSLGELFSQTFNLVFGNLPALIAIQAIFWLPVSVLNYLVGVALKDVSIQVDSSQGVELDQNLLIAGANLAFGFVSGLIVTPIMSAASMLVISDRFMGRRTSIGSAIGIALRRFGSLIMVGLVVNLCAGVVLALGFGVMGALTVMGLLGALVGLLFALASVVLFFWVQVTFSVAAPAVALENLRTGAALHRSRHLTAGLRMRIFLLMVTFFLILVAIGAALEISGAAAALSQQQQMAQLAVNMITSMVSSMIFCVAIVAVYFDLRVRKDGFDLDNLAELVDVIAHRAAIPYDRGIAPESSRDDIPRDDDDAPISRDT